MVELGFKYRYKGDQDWRTRIISNEEYFDLEVEKEPFEINSTPQYGHLIDYFDEDADKISAMFLKITDESKNDYLWFNQVYWNRQQHFINEITECNIMTEGETYLLNDKYIDLE